MSAAAACRAELAAIGRDLVALGGAPAERRGMTLAGTQPVAPPATFADLIAVPAWLRLPRPDLEGFAVRVALVAIGPALAGSIDGRWLGECARQSDDAAVDFAIARAGDVPGGGMTGVAAQDLPALGFDLLRAGLSPALLRYLDWAPGRDVAPDHALAAFCIDAVAP